MSDLLIRNLTPALRRQIRERARKNRRSLSEEVKTLIQRGLVAPDESAPTPADGMGTWLFSLLDDKYRSDDFVFERDDPVAPPPNFE